MATALIVCVEDYEPLARERLPIPVWDYIDGGAGAELALNANRAAFDRVAEGLVDKAVTPAPYFTVELAPRGFVVARWSDVGITLGPSMANPMHSVIPGRSESRWIARTRSSTGWASR